jgi:hypothetical protein
VDFGRRCSSRSPADWTRGTSQGGAPGRGVKVEAGEGERGSLVSPDFGVLARSNGELRRVNSMAWRRYSAREQRGNGEGGGATYRCGLASKRQGNKAY